MAGTGPLAARGADESRRRADAPAGKQGVCVRWCADELGWTRLTESSFETVGRTLANAVRAVEVEGTDAGDRCCEPDAPLSTTRPSYPTPATREGMLRVRAKPVMPPTMHRVPIT